ncbi:Zinc finger, PHD-type [Corchorus olitorius]|uniref:Zinc finger, PHD-type n=1 Tax=Corchorus olitorius TaxID=93759 RepID=A0A1R3KSW9_9ROSI|nr:Zinc finger, PHD-type [Corchorus olitorius]
MEERMRSGEHSGIVVKSRSQSGCLIVRKKGDSSGGAGSMGTRKIYESKKEKKRPRMIMSDSGSSDELVMPPRRRVGPETIQVCNGLAGYEESEIGRKRNREEKIRRSEEGLIGRNGVDLSESKRNRLDVFDFNEYDGLDDEITMRRNRFDYAGDEVQGRRMLGSMPTAARRSFEVDYESGPSRHVFLEKKKKNMYFDKSGGMSREEHDDRNRFRKDRDGGRVNYSLLRERYMVDSDEPIRVQGKNGVLKVMVNRKKKVGEPLKSFDHLEVEEARSGSRIDNTVRRNLHVRPALYSETEVLEKPVSLSRKEKNKMNLLKTPSAKKNKVPDWDSEDSDTSLKLQPKNTEASNSTKGISKQERIEAEQLLSTRTKEGKARRGCGTEKQKLRERIRGMLQDAGWTIDYRPRRNRDYLDAVYINPAGTAYWSIIKAYDALLKQQEEEEDEGKAAVDGAFTPLSDEVLSQLTRKTRKKMEREMKKKRKVDSDSENAIEAVARKSSSTKHEGGSMDSLSHEEKLSSYMKQGKSSKNRMNENGAFSASSKGQSSLHVRDSYEKPSSISKSHLVHGRKSRKLGRCTLLVRGSNVGQSSESDGFVPYSGKRTLLSWLIDCGAVQLSQKVQYMNRRRTKVMLEGWITREGIHCGCCSKILTVSKFEIHAGSKLRQPFQNIYLDSGVSLLQCQIDAWNRQEESEHIGFHSVDIDGDDPNDDTCGICGDGGDLICCDSCPSTFHQNCLSIESLPPGDWHCPNCICKFCGDGRDIAQVEALIDCALFSCSLCEKKYHKSCIKVVDDEVHTDSNSLLLPFCGQTCRELFEHLQKYLGVKHELEAGFTWSLVQRTDADSDTTARGLPQRVECNSKLAVALTVMDECFLPIVDRRSRINILNNVLYNCGSNFNRINYGGFYTAILERGDEIISAASIRFHGTKLAEMPFIGTRHIYRRQGMCRRLFHAIESALCSLKVEKLVIPAIAELTHTWTAVFGFTTVEDSLKQEMRSMNMLVFPGIDMLQKLLLEQENAKENLAVRGVNQTESGSEKCITPELANESKPGSSSGHDPQECDDGHASGINSENAAANSDSQCPNVSLNDTCGTSGSLDASLEPNESVSAEETALTNSPTGDKKDEFASDSKDDVKPSSSHDALEVEKKTGLESPTEDNTQSCKEGMDDTSAVGVMESKVATSEDGTIGTGSRSGDKAAESASDSKNPDISSMDYSAVDMRNKTVSDSPIEEKVQSCEDPELGAARTGDNVAADIKTELTVEETIYRSSEDPESDVAQAGDNVAAAASGIKTELTVEETICTNSQSGDKPVESPVGKSLIVSDESHGDTLEMENKRISDSPDEDNIQSSKGIDLSSPHPADNVAGPDELEAGVGVSVENTARADSESRLPESASPEKSVISATSANPDDLENKSALDLPSEDVSQSSKEQDDLCDKSQSPINNGGSSSSPQ